MRKEPLISKEETFLQRYGFTADEFQRTNLEWDVLHEIASRHVASSGELQAGQVPGALDNRGSDALGVERTDAIPGIAR